MTYRLLLADDSITIQKVVELILADEGFIIKTVGNGEAAWAVIQEFKPDIVLADIEMPVLNGYRLCEKIKTDPDTKDLPVILMAGAFEPLEEDTLKHVGADDYIIKPFESQELINKLNAVLAAREAAKSTYNENSIPETVDSLHREGSGTSEEDSMIGTTGEDFEAETLSSEDLSTEDMTAPIIDSIEETHQELAVPEESITEGAAEGFTVKAHLQPLPEFHSRDEITDIIKTAIAKQISSVFPLDDIRDSMDNILREAVPRLAEKHIEEILKTALASAAKEIEKVLWETVPIIAEKVILKEIEKIKSEM